MGLCLPKESSYQLEGQQGNKHIVLLHLFYKAITEEKFHGMIREKSPPFFWLSYSLLRG